MKASGIRAYRYQGLLVVALDGQVTLQLPDGMAWPLITLEPEIAAWWSALNGPMDACVMARVNPWGPWLMVEKRC